MGSKSPTRRSHAIAAENAFASLAEFCPDLDAWPQRWRYEAGDIATGQAIVAALTPFLEHLMRRPLSRRTLLRHRDNLWLLGGEIIRRLYEEPRLRKKSGIAIVQSLLEEEGGPLLHPYSEDNEPVQRSFDATCRQLYAFYAHGGPTSAV
jgi:hypothetical protein